ncbi:MAG: CRTAC1 family protein [Phycisphaerales bacterium]
MLDDELVPADDRVIGRALAWSGAILVALAAAGGVAWWLAHRAPPRKPVVAAPNVAPVVPTPMAPETLPQVPFTNITESAGIRFVYENGARGDKLLPETMGGGVAFLDVDNDGDQDLFFVNGTAWSWDVEKGAAPTSCALSLNDGHGRFTDATAGSGLEEPMHGMGCAAGDYDGDGLVDLFVTGVGPTRLYRNLGGGRFRDVAADAGVQGDPRAWSTGAAFVDLDRDGDLDLFVTHYVRWSREIDFEVDYRLTGIGRAYGPPDNFEGADSTLYRNNGDGTFTDVTEDAGIRVRNPATGVPVGKGLAVSPCDFDGDGWIDLVVANDKTQNFAFRNLGGEILATIDAGPRVAPLRFQEMGVVAGLAFDRNGAATGAMGIDAAQFLDNGLLAIAIGNFANEMTSFYVSRGGPMERLPYSDDAVNEGIGAPSRLSLKFGVLFLDSDLDGRLDLLQANGHIEDQISVTQPSQKYAQPAQLFWNRGVPAAVDGASPRRRACYVELPKSNLGDLPTPIVGRGVACADIDGDGDLDVILTQPKGPPLLLRNDQRSGHHWLRVSLRGKGWNRNAIGAVVVALAGGEVVQDRRVMPTRGYLSQVELPVTLGLGASTKLDELRIRWPDGKETRHAVEGIDRTIEVAEP